jgi:hypothetical protein
MSSAKPFGALAIAVIALATIGTALAQTGSKPSSSASLPQGFRLPDAVHPSSIMDIVPSTTKSYLDRADTVVLVKCVENRVEYGPGGNIFTFYAFETAVTIKGSAKPRFQIRLLGGTIGDVTISLAMEPDLTVGVEYVLMLGKENADGYPTLYLGAVFTIRTVPETGRKVVVPCSDGLPLYEKATGRRMQPGIDWCFLDDFIFSLNKAVQ